MANVLSFSIESEWLEKQCCTVRLCSVLANAAFSSFLACLSSLSVPPGYLLFWSKHVTLVKRQRSVMMTAGKFWTQTANRHYILPVILCVRRAYALETSWFTTRSGPYQLQLFCRTDARIQPYFPLAYDLRLSWSVSGIRLSGSHSPLIQLAIDNPTRRFHSPVTFVFYQLPFLLMNQQSTSF